MRPEREPELCDPSCATMSLHRSLPHHLRLDGSPPHGSPRRARTTSVERQEERSVQRALWLSSCARTTTGARPSSINGVAVWLHPSCERCAERDTRILYTDAGSSVPRAGLRTDASCLGSRIHESRGAGGTFRQRLTSRAVSMHTCRPSQSGHALTHDGNFRPRFTHTVGGYQ